jgi:hypothetical protein
LVDEMSSWEDARGRSPSISNVVLKPSMAPSKVRNTAHGLSSTKRKNRSFTSGPTWVLTEIFGMGDRANYGSDPTAGKQKKAITSNTIKEQIGPGAWKTTLEEQGAGVIPKAAKVPEGHDPDAEPEIKRRVPTQQEIDAALADRRENGIPRWRVKLLHEQYRSETDQIRAENFAKKKKKRD